MKFQNASCQAFSLVLLMIYEKDDLDLSEEVIVNAMVRNVFLIDWLIDYFVFCAILRIFQHHNGVFKPTEKGRKIDPLTRHILISL